MTRATRKITTITEAKVLIAKLSEQLTQQAARIAVLEARLLSYGHQP